MFLLQLPILLYAAAIVNAFIQARAGGSFTSTEGIGQPPSASSEPSTPSTKPGVGVSSSPIPQNSKSSALILSAIVVSGTGSENSHVGKNGTASEDGGDTDEDSGNEDKGSSDEEGDEEDCDSDAGEGEDISDESSGEDSLTMMMMIARMNTIVRLHPVSHLARLRPAVLMTLLGLVAPRLARTFR